MIIQPVEFPLNIGTATELRIYVLEHTDNGSSVNVHYQLVDTTKNTVLATSSTLPYKILHGNNIILDGQNYTNYKSNASSVEAFIASLMGATIVPVTQ